MVATATETYVAALTFSETYVALKVHNGASCDVQSVWGLDLSGSLQGAGGIGGVLGSTLGTNSCLYAYDANGNVMQLVDAGDGSSKAKYGRDPHGLPLMASGEYAYDNPFGFSTKYEDAESALVYYGHRYYSPELGRWLSREPRGDYDEGSLYAFLGNDACNWFDVLGLYKWQKGNPCRIKIEKGDTLWKISKETGIPIETLKKLNGNSDALKVGQVITIGNLKFRKKFTITFYCNCKECCGREPTDPNYGKCADGTMACEGTVAAEWHRLPPNSKISFTLDGTKFDGVVRDQGGAIKGSRLDVWCKTHKEALDKGIKKDVEIEIELDCSKVPKKGI